MRVCDRETSKRLNRSVQIFCGTSHDPRKGVCIIITAKNCQIDKISIIKIHEKTIKT